MKEKLMNLFEDYFKQKIFEIKLLPQSGSYRKYFRIKSKNYSVIGTYNLEKKENIAFISFSKHFKNKILHVPKIYVEDLENNIYLQEDFGDITLFDYIKSIKNDEKFDNKILDIYKKVLEQLPRFQVIGGKNIDYTKCYPRKEFDEQSIMWDLNYFKYFMLKIAKVPFDEQELELDFKKLSDFLISADTKYFLYRDFQSRNIMLKDNIPFFIDYQGGRRGALHYDLASLLYDAKANISQQIRNQLVEFYIKELQKYIDITSEDFYKHYFAYVLIRQLQALGAYGFRGLIEKKLHFIQSIPYALKNLKYIIEQNLNVEIPELKKAILYLINESEVALKDSFKTAENNKLKVQIKSFSYIYGEIPKDESGHGGGYVFDCRILQNPGREEKYQNLTGKDKEVVEYLEAVPEVESFISNVYLIVSMAIKKYIKRDHTNLSINFGCTGGQHRSVYTAEKITKLIKENFNIAVELEHVEL